MHVRNALFDPLSFADILVYIIVGNHDCYFRNTNLLNTPDLFLSEYSNIIIVSEPQVVPVKDVPVLMVPWINEKNYDLALEYMQTANAEICMGHFELTGFEMYRGMGVCQNGFSPKHLKRFNHVFSGHFHQPSKQGNIQYLGAPMQYTWSDFDCERGFSYFDLEDFSLSFNANPDPMFLKLYYDNGCQDEIDFSLDNKTVRLIVSQKDDQEQFDKFIETLTNSNKMFDFSVVDNSAFKFDAENIEVSEEALADEDTLAITKDYIETMDDTTLSGKRLERMFNDIYTLASNEL